MHDSNRNPINIILRLNIPKSRIMLKILIALSRQKKTKLFAEILVKTGNF